VEGAALGTAPATPWPTVTSGLRACPPGLGQPHGVAHTSHSPGGFEKKTLTPVCLSGYLYATTE